jgi:hypothetical protein
MNSGAVAVVAELTGTIMMNALTAKTKNSSR